MQACCGGGRQRPLISAALVLTALGVLWWIDETRLDTPELIVRDQRMLMGTIVEIMVPAQDLDQTTIRTAINHAFDEMEAFVAKVNTWAATCELQILNDHAGMGPVMLSPEVLDVLATSQRLSELTDGAFDVTVAPLLTLWFQTVPKTSLPTPTQVEQARAMVDWQQLLVDKPHSTAQLNSAEMSVGLGAIAKGTATDVAIAALQQAGVNNALINSGGDLYALGQRQPGQPWRVGVRNPFVPSGYFLRLFVTNLAVATSGDYEQRWEREGQTYTHIIDPRTGYPSALCSSVTVIAESAELADGLATGLFVLGTEQGAELVESLAGVEAIFVGSAGQLVFTSGVGQWVDQQELDEASHLLLNTLRRNRADSQG